MKEVAFHSDDCITLEQLNELVVNDKAQVALKPVDLVFEDHIDRLSEDEYIRFKNGAILSQTEFPQFSHRQHVIFEERLISIYDSHPK